MAKFTLTCAGPLTIDADNKPICVDGWETQQLQTAYLTSEDFNAMWPLFLLLFVTAYTAKALRRMLVNF